MTRNKTVNLLLEVLGCFISAAGIYSFAVASEIPVTGVAGLCAILYRLFGVPMGLSNILINIPIILGSYKLLGRPFFLRSLRCMILFALFTDYVLPYLPEYSGDRLLATLCGGVVSGIGDALIYMQNSSTGGLDFVTMAIKTKRRDLPFGNITFGAALAVILLNGAVFRDVDSIRPAVQLPGGGGHQQDDVRFCLLHAGADRYRRRESRLPGDRPGGGPRFHHPAGTRRVRRPAQGRGAVRLLQQAAL